MVIKKDHRDISHQTADVSCLPHACCAIANDLHSHVNDPHVAADISNNHAIIVNSRHSYISAPSDSSMHSCNFELAIISLTSPPRMDYSMEPEQILVWEPIWRTIRAHGIVSLTTRCMLITPTYYCFTTTIRLVMVLLSFSAFQLEPPPNPLEIDKIKIQISEASTWRILNSSTLPNSW